MRAPASEASTHPVDPKSVGSLGEVLDFMRTLWAVDHGLQATSKHMEATLGVTGPQRLVIRMLARFPDATPGRLAKLLHTHPSTLTGVLARLEERGLLSRRPDPLDGRRARLRLTARGERIDATRSGTVESAVRKMVAATPKSSLASAERVLGALAAELDAVCRGPRRSSGA
jgi:DNA-binding MarR family transcriptional regulator